MEPYEVVGWAATTTVIASYAASVWFRRPRIYHWTNAVTMVPFIYSEAMVGAWWLMVLSAAMGVVGWVGLIRDKTSRDAGRVRRS